MGRKKEIYRDVYVRFFHGSLQLCACVATTYSRACRGERKYVDTGDCIVVYTRRLVGVHFCHTATAAHLPILLLPVV